VIELVEANNHKIDAIPIRRSIIEWGNANFRDFPWRMTGDPYHILMSEVMLHRTQARQVVPVYEQFIQAYPDMRALSKATKEELKEMLYSLGLHWRIDLIYEMANELIDQYGGIIPRSKKDLLTLPGISEYIAGAVRCFAWNLPEPLLDTNTVRVTGRLFNLEIKDSSRRSHRFRELNAALIDPEQPRAYNYALLDLADQICMKKRPPECPVCPVRQYCAYKPGRTHDYPE
jgi:A/G-specific adenine glycosylase